MRLVLHSKPAAERWRHIYGCYKKKLLIIYSFAELCFDCSEWIVDKNEWNDHCQNHLRRPKTLPVQCNPFVYHGTLACPEYCFFCVEDTALSASTRMQHFLDREKWKTHIDRHMERLDGCKALKRSHSRSKCVDVFPSVLELKFHLQDVHCIEFIKKIKRRKFESEENTLPARKKRPGKIKNHGPDVKLEV